MNIVYNNAFLVIPCVVQVSVAFGAWARSLWVFQSLNPFTDFHQMFTPRGSRDDYVVAGIWPQLVTL